MAKQLFKNIGFLTVSQAANYVFPLITIPYVTRVVGPENYGLIEFATVAMLYFSAVVIYGFNTTATRKIAEAAGNELKIARVFSTVLYTRIVLFLATTVVFGFGLIFIEKFSEQKLMMLMAYPIVLGWALYPDFLFQGIQKLKVIAFVNFAIKALAAVLIFALLAKPEDFYFVLAINGGAQLLAGVGTLFYAHKSLSYLTFKRPQWSAVKAYLENGSYIFLSHFFTRVYTFGSIIFLGLLLTDKQLGLFAAGMKLIIVAQSFLFLPLFGALFPYLTNLYKTDRPFYFVQFKKAFLLMIGVAGISTLVLAAAPRFFVQLVFGADYLAAAPYLRIMAPILVATTISHFSMQQGLIILKRDKTYLAIIVSVGLLSLLLNYVVIINYQLVGAAWVKLGVDVLLGVLGWIYFQRALKSTAS